MTKELVKWEIDEECTAKVPLLLSVENKMLLEVEEVRPNPVFYQEVH
tara:strand:+ start:468 stop:608 length:141 start_codon:yes stop_codon:yes gene_type:complete